jgi:hypothetical protein
MSYSITMQANGLCKQHPHQQRLQIAVPMKPYDQKRRLHTALPITTTDRETAAGSSPCQAFSRNDSAGSSA